MLVLRLLLITPISAFSVSAAASSLSLVIESSINYYQKENNPEDDKLLSKQIKEFYHFAIKHIDEIKRKKFS